MSPTAVDIAQKIQMMTEPEIEYLWGVLRKRHDETLLTLIDMKLTDSMNSETLSDDEAEQRLARLRIA
jgi:hypothetical protein